LHLHGRLRLLSAVCFLLLQIQNFHWLLLLLKAIGHRPSAIGASAIGHRPSAIGASASAIGHRNVECEREWRIYIKKIKIKKEKSQQQLALANCQLEQLHLSLTATSFSNSYMHTCQSCRMQ
jgi:hypothetical protein